MKYSAFQFRFGVLAVAFASGAGLFIATSRHTTAASTVAAARIDDQVQFNRDIRPILTDNCFHCHGPDPASRKAGLRLDRDSGLFGQTDNGVSVVAGKPDQSDLYARIISDDEDELMPPPSSKKIITPKQKELIKKWIQQGAKWEAHWSFNAPQKASPPKSDLEKWNANPIDQFVFAKLKENGLAPANEADRRTLARRSALDIIGIPPEPADVETFLKDTSPDAYEKYVDHLIAMPQFGEHRGRYWLDAARYGDTHGLHFDNYREMWPYRNWVINSINANMPFNQFSTEQLAGDLLPNRTVNQQIATGFVRCGITTNEGGTIAEENLVIYARDRTETAARVWLGLTMNCCVCHDHKFDPISQKDFYSLSAYFNNNTMSALDGNIKNTPPAIVIPSTDDEAAWKLASAKQQDLKSQLEARKQIAKPDFDKWLANATPVSVAANLPSRDMSFHAALDEGGEARKVSYTFNDQPLTSALHASAKWMPGNISSNALLVESAGAVSFPDAGDFEMDKAHSVALWVKLPAKAGGSIVARMDDDNAFRGWDIFAEGGRIGGHIVNHWDDNAIKVMGRPAVDATKWHHVCLTYDGTQKAAGMQVYVDGKAQKLTVVKDVLNGSIRTKVPLKVGQRSKSSLVKGMLAEDLRIYNRKLSSSEVSMLASSTLLKNIVAKAAAKRTDAEKKNLFDWYLTNNDEPSEKIAAELDDVQLQVDQIKARGAQTLVMEEKPTPAGAFVLYRGEYDKRREAVVPATPAVLPKLPEKAPANRLALAQWLFSTEHPLTARVTVNRFWQDIFGAGLVRSSDDFGITGDSPSHPELLDYLAVDFRENNWDVKRLIKQIVTSQTYRQAAITTPEKLEKDVSNRLLSRGPRFRMDAEMIRDSALATSELLVKKIGGASVRPYQPAGIWEVVGMPGSDTRNYVQDHGDGLYRRSVYTFWKRGAPPASLDAFNAPSREQCTVRRERTNTPLQALVTLNDVQYMEAARNLAQLGIKQSADDKARINFMSLRVLSRPMTDKELTICIGTLNDLTTHYQAHKDEATKLISYGETKADTTIDPATHAAWTMLANQIMNLDEALNK